MNTPARRLAGFTVVVSTTKIADIQRLRRDLLEHKYGPQRDTFAAAGQRALDSATRELLTHGLVLTPEATEGLEREAALVADALMVSPPEPIRAPRPGPEQHWSTMTKSERRAVAAYYKASAIAARAIEDVNGRKP